MCLGEEELVVDGVFDVWTDGELAVDVEHAGHFGFAVGGVGGEEVAEFGLQLWVGELQGLEVEECFFVVADVLTGGFAEGGGVAVTVEEVVLELEGEA